MVMARRKELKFTWLVEEDKEAIQKAFEVIMRGDENENSSICPGEHGRTEGRANS